MDMASTKAIESLQQKKTFSRRSSSFCFCCPAAHQELFSSLKSASAVAAPDQTPEEAEAAVRAHARDLPGIKALSDAESRREAQLALRESSLYSMQDWYTIIQSKPGSLRPRLRQLYSDLFCQKLLSDNMLVEEGKYKTEAASLSICLQMAKEVSVGSVKKNFK